MATTLPEGGVFFARVPGGVNASFTASEQSSTDL
jgi:hypothetical protein